MDERAGQAKKRPAGKDKKVDLDNLKREMEMVRASPFYVALSPQRGEFHKRRKNTRLLLSKLPDFIVAGLKLC